MEAELGVGVEPGAGVAEVRLAAVPFGKAAHQKFVKQVVSLT